MKNIFQKIEGPLIAVIIFSVLFILWRILHLPPQDELVIIARSYFNQYGLLVVLLSAFIEGLLFVGWYYPGSLVIFLGVIFAGRDFGHVSLVVLIVIIGLLSAYITNFFIGRYGWYKLFLKFGFKGELAKAEQRLTHYGWLAIFMTYWQPNIASLTAAASGILHISFKKFLMYSVTASILWNIFWGILVYVWGEAALTIIGPRFILIFLSVWILYQLFFTKIED